MFIFTRIKIDAGSDGHKSWTSYIRLKRSQKLCKLLIWEILITLEKNPKKLRHTECLTTNYMTGEILRPYSSRQIVGANIASSNSFTPCNWIGDTTYRTPQNRRNL